MAIFKRHVVDGDANFPKKFVTLRASEAITKGDLVALDLSDSTNGLGASIRPADVATDATAGGGQPVALGFATEGVKFAKEPVKFKLSLKLTPFTSPPADWKLSA